MTATPHQHEERLDLTTTRVTHHALRRDLAAFARAVPHTPLDDGVAWRALLRRWELLSAALRLHLAEGTWLWPRLRERAGRDEQVVLEAMAAQREELGPLLASCGRGLRLLASGRGRPDDRAALGVRLCAAKESLGRHLAHQERAALTLRERHLTRAEWEEAESRSAEGLGTRERLALVPWRLHELPDETAREARRRAGPCQRLLWRLTHRGFERLDRRAFRHLPPAQNA